jgi:predicted N-formylglutamate amidohydrolase
MNFPYSGRSDSHTTALRRRFSKDVYLGIELEINQRLLEDDQGQARVGKLLRDAFRKSGIGISRK